MPTVCKISDCNSPKYVRGWCKKHYSRWWVNGDPLVTRRAANGTPISERILRFVTPGAPEECWEWEGRRNSNNYGMFGRNKVASRIAYEVWVGPIPEGKHICHACDNPPCVNPAHLFLGTAKDNANDKVAKRRHTWGEGHPSHWLTDEQVARIRELHKQGLSQARIASKFGCSQPYVGELVRFEKRRMPSKRLA